MALLLVLPACGDDGGKPAAADCVLATGEPRSVTGQAVRIPPMPANGFDPPVTVTFEGAPPIRARVARTVEQRSRGLMQCTSLPEGTGMLFLFPYRAENGFYMKGTLIPLSIAYVDGDRVVATREMEPCPGEQCPTYAPGKPYTAAVEAVAGFFPQHGVKEGTKVSLDGTTASPA